MAQEGMFWKLVLEDVIENTAEFLLTQTMDLCGRIKKDTVEVATGANLDKA